MGFSPKEYRAYLIAEGAGEDLRVTFASPEACRVLGMSAQELVGTDPGAVRGARYLGRMVLPDGRSVIVCAGEEDMTLLEQLEKTNLELERALQAANSANEAKTSFLSNMSHDIRTPMNAIIGMTAIAQKHLDEKSRVQDCLSKIQSASNHLLSLINDVLDMSRIDSKRVCITEAKFSLADLVHDLMVIVRPLAEARDQTLLVDVGEIRQEALMGDVLYLRQVFLNVINNAVKYTPQGGEIRVKFAQRPGGDPMQVLLDFTCADNGIGMSEEFCKRVFLPFERAANTTRSQVEGTGLGMAITRSLVEEMGGSVGVESTLGKGSTFTITIPLSVCGGQAPEAPLSGMTVLTVDGDGERAAAIQRYIAQAGGRAAVCATDNEAIAWTTRAQFAGETPGAVLLGSMKEGVVLELTAYLRSQLGPGVPIYLVGEQDWNRLEYSGKRAGLTGFIPCPLFRGRLIETLCSREGHHSAGEETDLRGMHVLLAEDNELNREIATELISETGAEVFPAENGQVAVERFEKAPEGFFDLVLMDVQMPVMDGYEATRRIRALHRPDAGTVCIAAMTANAFVDDIKKSRAAGMNEHLSKPVDVESLKSLMRRCRRPG